MIGICLIPNKHSPARVQEWLGHANVSTTRLRDIDEQGRKVDAYEELSGTSDNRNP